MYVPSGKEEKEYLKRYDPNQWPKPSVAADIAVFGYARGALYLLLVERGNYPYRGCWALPGGFVNMDEDLPETASRELLEETGLSGAYIEHISVWGKPGRDPRDRTISTLNLALVDMDKVRVRAGDDASSAKWFLLKDYIELRDYFETGRVVRSKKIILEGDVVLAPQIRQIVCYGDTKCVQAEITDDSEIAFDHAHCVIHAYEKLKERLLISDFAYGVLGRIFSLNDMKTLYDTVFRKDWGIKELAGLQILEQLPGGRYTWVFC